MISSSTSKVIASSIVWTTIFSSTVSTVEVEVRLSLLDKPWLPMLNRLRMEPLGLLILLVKSLGLLILLWVKSLGLLDSSC